MHPWIPSIRLHHFLSIGHGDGILRPRHGEGSRDQQLRRGLVTEVVCHRTGGRLEEENVQVQPKDIEVPKARRSWRLFQVEKTENTKGSFENHKIGILMKNFQGILICKLEKKIYIYIWYTIWLFNSSPWKILYNMEVYSWENHLFQWAMASIAMLVITRG